MTAVCVVGIVATVSGIGMYADGSYFLFRILSDQQAFVANAERPFVTLLTQLPLLLAMAVGVRSPDALVTFHSVGLVLLPTGAWATALWLQRRSDLFWLFALMWAGGYLVVGFFAIGEYNLTYALAALAGSLLLTDLNVARIRPYLILTIAVVLLRSYESMLFLGPALSVLCIAAAHLHHRPEPRHGIAVIPLLLVSSFVFLTDAVLALGSARNPENAGRVGTALDLQLLLDDPRLRLASVGAAGLVLTVVVAKYRSLRILVAALTTFAALPFALLPIASRLPGFIPGWLVRPWPPTYDNYNSRVAAGGLLLLLLVGAGLRHIRSHRRHAVERSPRRTQGCYWVGPAAVTATLALLFVANSADFGLF